jgi:hypothetical protein
MPDRAKKPIDRTTPPRDELILHQLEELTEKLGISLRREKVPSGPGGLCRVRDHFVLIVDSQAPLPEQIRVITESLQRFDLSDVYVRPGLRELLARSEE